jgi:NAD(P)H dehydrogenase (quinone)
MHNPTPGMRMLDGCNEGWITFEHDPLKGRVELQAVLRGIIERAS